MKILESGSPASSSEYNASRRQIDWQNFVSGVPSCASLAASDDTFDCLRKANSTEMFSGINAAISKAPELFAFQPTFDGPDGFIPAPASTILEKGIFAKIPFIAGTNLDEVCIYPQKRKFIIPTTQMNRNLLHPTYGVDRNRPPR